MGRRRKVAVDIRYVFLISEDRPVGRLLCRRAAHSWDVSQHRAATIFMELIWRLGVHRIEKDNEVGSPD